MDVINGIGAVLIIFVCALMAPINYLIGNPVVLIGTLFAALVVGVLLASRKSDERKRVEDERIAEVKADPFKAATAKEIDFWNGVRECCMSEGDWQEKRKGIVGQIEHSIEYNERKRDEWRTCKQMCEGYQRKVDECKRELPLWQDGGVFDKPLSWGSYEIMEGK